MKRYLIAFGMLCFFLVAFSQYTSWWGVNPFRYLSFWYASLLLLPFALRLKFCKSLVTWLAESRYAVLIVPLLFYGLCRTFPVVFPILGDGFALVTGLWRILNGMESNIGTLYLDYGGYQLTRMVVWLTGSMQLPNTQAQIVAIQTIFREISFVCGFLYAVVVVWYVKRLDILAATKFYLIVGLLFSTSSVIFFGYVEYYPILIFSVAGFILSIFAHHQGRATIYEPIAFYALALFSHSTAIILAPILLAVFLKGKFASNLASRVGAGIILVLVMGLMTIAKSIHFEFLTWARLIEPQTYKTYVNMILLLIPATIPAALYIKTPSKKLHFICLFCCGIMFLIFPIVIMRDWDTVAFTVPVIFVAVMLSIENVAIQRLFAFHTAAFGLLWIILCHSPEIVTKVQETTLLPEVPQRFFLSTNENCRKYFYYTSDLDNELACIFAESLRDTTSPVFYKVYRALELNQQPTPLKSNSITIVKLVLTIQPWKDSVQFDPPCTVSEAKTQIAGALISRVSDPEEIYGK